MTINLKNILSVIPNIVDSEQYQDININTLKLDSRQVVAGDLFIACIGSNTDGRQYIINALANGAKVVLYDSYAFKIEEIPDYHLLSSYKNALLIPVLQLNQYISALAGKFFNEPSMKHCIYAMTGTNGKTTCAYLLAQILHQLNKRVGLIGTIGYGEISKILHNNNFNKLLNTTPDPILLQSLLDNFNKQGIDHVVMEASSHALLQYRLTGINTETAIFTNLTHDHLDYHYTIENYYLAKRKLFFYNSVKNIVINLDDMYGLRLLKELLDTHPDINNKNIIVYSMHQNILAEYGLQHENIQILSYYNNKIYYNNNSYELKTSLIGKFNLYNLLAVIGALLINKYDITQILNCTVRLQPAPGRMEVFTLKKNQVRLIVDYAHTPDALQKTLMALTEDVKHNNIWCIFGCGGDRDSSKRPEMAAVAVNYADKIIITDDNPRTELPEKIIADIKKGIKSEDSHKLFAIINDRREAIRTALSNANEHDIIFIAGKGHEDYQIYGTEYLDYNERKFVSELTKDD